MADMPIGMFMRLPPPLPALPFPLPPQSPQVLLVGACPSRASQLTNHAPQCSTEELVSSRSDMLRRSVTISIPLPTLTYLSFSAHEQNFPEHQFPSIVGRPILRTEEQAGDIVVKDIMCGDEAAAARSMLQITYPVRPSIRVPSFYPPIAPLSPRRCGRRVNVGPDLVYRWRMVS